MNLKMDLKQLEAAAEYVRGRWPDLHAELAVVCGSGWSSVLDAVEVVDRISYRDIPGLGAPGVVGHAGTLCHAKHAGKDVLVFQGRRHFYEGEGWTPVAVPVYLCLQFGVKNLLLTNSAGAIHPDFAPGDLMLITDHINQMGDNPLVGPHHEVFGPRFPDQSTVYAPDAVARLRSASKAANVSLREGVYLATRGPVYETPAEVRACRLLGADAVGMSTVPEAMLASASGIRVGGLSCMTNYAAGILDQPLTHDEVTTTANAAMPRMSALLLAWIATG
jgi:purine-nucleoside phosphorylase